MKSRQTGVSLVEMTVVIIILVVAAGAALPRKLGLPALADAAAVAMTVNYAGCATTGHEVADKTCLRITSCQQAGLLMQVGLPSGHRVEGQSGQFNGDSLRCRVVAPDGSAADFSGLVAGV